MLDLSSLSKEVDEIFKALTNKKIVQNT